MRDIIRTTLLAAAFLACFGSLGCSQITTLHGLGTIQPGQLCPDLTRCDARGDIALSTLGSAKARPIYLADGQGPQSYLGKVAPERQAASALMTCGGDITKDDWYETAPTLRTLELSDRGKRELKLALRTHFAEALNANPKVLDGTDATPEAAAEAAAVWLNVKKVSFVSQTFWLKDASFERRVDQCGEENYDNIIYSFTLIRLSDLMHKELESRILDGLDARLTNRPALLTPSALHEPPESEAAQGEQVEAETEATAKTPTPGAAISAPHAAEDARYVLMQELAYKAVHALASELRVIAAFGYDEK